MKIAIQKRLNGTGNWKTEAIITNGLVEKDGTMLTKQDSFAYLNSLPTALAEKGAVKASEDIETWFKAMSLRNYTYWRVILL